MVGKFRGVVGRPAAQAAAGVLVLGLTWPLAVPEAPTGAAPDEAAGLEFGLAQALTTGINVPDGEFTLVDGPDNVIDGQGGGAQTTTYTVLPGDTLSGIARRHGVTLLQLLSVNSQIINPNRIFPGQQIIIPAPGSSGPRRLTTFTVRLGDTLSGIARLHGVTLLQLLSVNSQIINPNRIFPGQRIVIPDNQVVITPTASSGGSQHTVVLGDTLSQISRLHEVPVPQLLAANPQIINPNLIFPGQLISIG